MQAAQVWRRLKRIRIFWYLAFGNLHSAFTFWQSFFMNKRPILLMNDFVPLFPYIFKGSLWERDFLAYSLIYDWNYYRVIRPVLERKWQWWVYNAPVSYNPRETDSTAALVLNGGDEFPLRASACINGRWLDGCREHSGLIETTNWRYRHQDEINRHLATKRYLG